MRNWDIGKRERTTINQLAELTVKLVGGNVKPIHEEPRPGDIRHSLADISKARGFHHNPKYDLEQGLEETMAIAVAGEGNELGSETTGVR